MGLLQNMLSKIKEKKEALSDYETEMKIKEIAERKRLSSDERELMRFYEEDRQRAIKQALKERRKKMIRDIWEGKKGNPVNAPNILLNHKSILKQPNIFGNAQSIFNQPDLFFKK